MMKLAGEQIIEATDAQYISGEKSMIFTGVNIDSRLVNCGDLFVAIKGERSDGHDFISSAIENGARGVLINEYLTDSIKKQLSDDVLCLKVEDAVSALQKLAHFVRCQSEVFCIGITGSNGKTTGKDLIYSVLNEQYRTLKTEGNYNNEIGLPLTLLKLEDDHQIAVLEMGMSAAGEINTLRKIACPDIAVITNVAGAHLESLGSLENIAAAKGEILDGVGEKGIALLNGDNLLVRSQAYRCQGKVLYYGLNEDNDLQAVNIRCFEQSLLYDLAYRDIIIHDIFVPLPGKHNILNSLPAVAIGLMKNINAEIIKKGLKNCQFTSMRLQFIDKNKITFINDAYNANADSMIAALEVLTGIKEGRKIAVLGDMFELGCTEREEHKRVGANAKRLGVDYLIAVGALSADIAAAALAAGMEEDRVFWFADKKQTVVFLSDLLKTGDRVLIKGSRGMAMEEIINELDYADKA